MKLVHTIRRALGVRRERALPPVGPKPRLGARIVNGDLRMTVQAGLTEATWRWLTEQGWREQSFRNDRRAYREVPPSMVASLFDAADPDERAQMLHIAVSEARARPAVAPLRHL
jgi:hypothetical protein